MKRTQEDEPSKARRGWQRGRGRPPKNGDTKNGDNARAAAGRKRSRSVFGPSGEDRPDMLTDAETVVLPVWLHHRPSPTEGATAEDAAAFLKTITAPPQPDEAPVTEPETGERVAHEPDAEAEAGTGTGTGTGTGAEADAEVASGAGEAGTAGGPPEGEPAKRQPADGGQDDGGTEEAERAEAAEAKVAEAEAEAGAGTEADAKADSNSKAGTEADAKAEADSRAKEATDVKAEVAPDAKTKGGAEADADADPLAAGEDGGQPEAGATARTKPEPESGAGGRTGIEAEDGADGQVKAAAEVAADADAGTEAGTPTDAAAETKADADARDTGTKADAETKAAGDTEAKAGAGTKADGDAKPKARARARARAGGKANGHTKTKTKAEPKTGAGAQDKTGAEDKADTEIEAPAGDDAGAGAEGGTAGGNAAAARTDAEPTAADLAASASPAAASPSAGDTGPDAATQPAATRPDSEAIITLSLADLHAASLKAKIDQAAPDEATTLVTSPVPTNTGPANTGPTVTGPAETGPAESVGAKTVEAIEAIDALETKTIDGLEATTAEALETVGAIEAIEAKTAEAIEAIEAMTADALEAIDTSAAEIAATVAGEPGPADPAQPDRRDSTQPDLTEGTASSPGTELTQPYVISIEEPPASVTLTTSATETTIAVPQPRAESTVAVTPTPAAATASALTSAPQRTREKPAALPPGESGPQAEPEAKPAHVTTRRRTRVSRGLLLAILCLQAVLSLRLHNTAFEDEALYIYSGHMELEHLLHGAALQGQYASYFSGSPVLYPVAAGFLNALGGLTAARMLSLVEMLSITALLYSMTRRLFNERIALCAALLFSVCESAIFLGNFATYDATCLFLLACAAWIVIRTAGFRWPVFLMAAPVAALAVGVKYAGLLFVPTIAVLPALAGWPLRGRRTLLYPPAFVVAVAGLLYGALRLGGKAYMTAISSTTTNRVQGVTSVSTLLRESAEWGGVIFALALIGTAAYVWRVRTEPEELIAPAGGRFRRLCLGVVLSGTALLAPAYQAHLHTDISFQKHIGFGLFFAAPIAAFGLARLLGDHFRRPHIAVGVWSLALVLGLVQTSHLYQVWPNSTQFVRAFSKYLQPHARYLVEVPEVPIYYLLGHADAQPRQFTSTFYINYVNSKGVLLSGTVGFTAAVNAGYFHVVAYNGNVTAAADAVLAQALSASKDYYLAAEIHITDVFGPGDYFIWVKGHRPKPSGVFHHASTKYQDLGTKLRELAP